eukprot:TRINITY_DN2618_c0_g1_i1.p1 TRINITY_DN2618_c0_g1~~TRINITY_DN2618_c0_g1_i1.p1  ORF type:complete len:945 (-),score=127.18 TRINITY_DN2618_c0_g1_i1:110-2944(-)
MEASNVTDAVVLQCTTLSGTPLTERRWRELTDPAKPATSLPLLDASTYGATAGVTAPVGGDGRGGRGVLRNSQDIRGVDFGQADGQEVSNKSTILNEIDALYCTPEQPPKPPDVELIFTEPYTIGALGLSATMNPYGHVAVRYRTPTGESTVMNIRSSAGEDMVNFLKPEEYLFGTHHWDTSNDQGAIYNRNFVSIRIENVDQPRLDALHNFYIELQQKWRSQEVCYSSMTGGIRNWFSGKTTSGNCSFWIGEGLRQARIIEQTSDWPKELWMILYEKYHRFEEQHLLGHNIMHIVKYQRIVGVNSYGYDRDASGYVRPLSWYSSYKYSNLALYADLMVSVPKDTRKVELKQINSSLRNRKGGQVKFSSLSKTLNLYCTNSWQPLASVIDDIGYLTVSARLIAIGSHSDTLDIWIVDSHSNVYCWNSDLLRFVINNFNIRSVLGNDDARSSSRTGSTTGAVAMPALEQIVIGNDNGIYMVYRGGAIVCLRPGNSKHMHTLVTQRRPISEQAGRLKHDEPRSVKHVTFVSAQEYWALDATGQVFYNVNSRWYLIPDIKLGYIAVARDNSTVWGLDRESRIFRKKLSKDLGTPWDEIAYPRCPDQSRSNWFVQIAAADKTNVWALDKSGMVYVWEEHEQLFSPLGNIAESSNCEEDSPAQLYEIAQIAINADGIACGASRTGTVYLLSKHRLQLSTAKKFRKIWDDEGTGCKPYDVAFWRPKTNDHTELEQEQQQQPQQQESLPSGSTPCTPRDEQFYPLGDMAERSHHAEPMSVSVVVRERFDTPAAEATNPRVARLLAPAVDFVQVWNDTKSGGTYRNTCSLWRPIPPADFAALGDVAEPDQKQKPDALTAQRCVHQSILTPVSLFLTEALWTTATCWSTHRVSLWHHAEEKRTEEGTDNNNNNNTVPHLLPVFTAHPAVSGMLSYTYPPPDADAHPVYWFADM